MLDKLRSIDKKFLIAGIGIFLVIVGVVFYLLSNKITNVELIKLKELSDKTSDYIGEVINNKEEDGCYVTFAIDYLYATTGKTSYSIDEIMEVINNNFDINLTKEDVSKIGLTSYMMNKGISFDTTSGGFSYEYKKTRADVASTSLINYHVTGIKKVNKNKFIVYYDKYLVEDPYKLLNYYTDQEEQDKEVVKEITSYVKGEIVPSKIVKYINSENIEKIGKIDGKIKVTYTVKDDKIRISKIG